MLLEFDSSFDHSILRRKRNLEIARNYVQTENVFCHENHVGRIRGNPVGPVGQQYPPVKEVDDGSQSLMCPFRKQMK